MKKLATYKEEIESTVPATVTKPTTFEITEEVMEFTGGSYYTAKVNEAGRPVPQSFVFYHQDLRFRFTGETAEELYEALCEMTLAHPKMGFGAVLKVDKEVVNPKAGGLKILLEMVPGTHAKLDTWEVVRDGLRVEEEAFNLHKGHVTGAIGVKARLVSFGKKAEVVETWMGRDE